MKLKWLSKEKVLRFCNTYALALHFAASFLLYFIMEWLARRSFINTVAFFDRSTKVFLYNTLLVFLTTLPVFLFRRRVFWRSLIFSVWVVLGIANGVLLANRVTPLTGPDLKMVSEGVWVFGRYMSKAQGIAVTVFLVSLAAAHVFLFFFAPKYKGKRHFKIIIPGILASAVGFFGLTQLYYSANYLSTYFGNIAFAYQDYGFPYCLLVTVADTGIDKPQNYSERLIRSIVNREGDPDIGKTDDLPNVIMVQLESFFDPTAVKYLDFSEDPLPNWHALSKEYTSGMYTVPTIGAGTVNTEFETLTGMSLRFFGAGEYPFKGVLKEETCESVGYVLEQFGLSAHAVHDNYATFYSRKTVYANLGFEDFTSSEYMDNQDDINEIGWMHDRTMIPYIGKCLDSTYNRDFVFAVSVQGHGAYPTAELIEEPAIEVTGAESTEKNCQWEYYVNQIHEMDKFVKDLIDYVDERGEPAVIMFYGDHLPTMGLSDNDLVSGNIYQTKYLIWDNIGLKKKKKNISAYQAAAELFDRMDLHAGTLFRYHQTMQKRPDYLLNLQTLQYDILYGDRYIYHEMEPYSKKKMQMGVYKIILDSIEPVTDSIYYVRGENFTQSSKLLANKEEYPTFFVNDQTLLVTGLELEGEVKIRVGQLSNSGSGKYLSYSNTIVNNPKEPADIRDLMRDI